MRTFSSTMMLGIAVAALLACSCLPLSSGEFMAPTPYASRRARAHAPAPNFWESPEFLGDALGSAFEHSQDPRAQRRMHAPASRFRQVMPSHLASRRADSMSAHMGRSFGTAPELAEISSATRKSLPYGAKRDGSFMEVMNSIPLPTRYAEDPFGNAEEAAPAPARRAMPTQVQVFRGPSRFEAPAFEEVLDQLTDIHAPASFLQMKTRSRTHPFVDHHVVAAPSFTPPLAPPPPPRRGPPPPRALSELDERPLIGPAGVDSMPLLETGSTVQVHVVDMEKEQRQQHQLQQQQQQQLQQKAAQSLRAYTPPPAAKKPAVWYVGPQATRPQPAPTPAAAAAPKQSFNNGVMLETAASASTAASAAKVAAPRAEPVLALRPPTVVHVMGRSSGGAAPHEMDEDEHELWD